jgi:hypothetical protein
MVYRQAAEKREVSDRGEAPDSILMRTRARAAKLSLNARITRVVALIIDLERIKTCFVYFDKFF